MKRLSDESDLKNFGFIALSAEGCGLGMRRLYDLTPDAVKILEEFLSVKIEVGNNWNSDEGQVASIMMPWSLIDQLSAFCLIYKLGYDVAVVVKFRCDGYSAHFVQGFTRDEWKEEVERFRTLYPNGFHVYNRTGNAVDGTRNRHYFSGRSR